MSLVWRCTCESGIKRWGPGRRGTFRRVGQGWGSSPRTSQRSEVLGLGKGRWEGVQARRSAWLGSGGWLGKGPEGLAGPVKRFGLYLTDYAVPSESFRPGCNVGNLAFQQALPIHSMKSGLDKAVSTDRTVLGGRG